MKALYTLPLALAMAVTLASPALAAQGPSLTSSLGNMQFTTLDLTPADGVDASYRLSNERISFRSALTIHGSDAPSYNLAEQLAPGQAADNTFAHGPFTVAQSTSGALGDARFSIDWERDKPFPQYGANMSNLYSYDATLTLAAGTAIVLSGHLEQRFIPAGIDHQNLATSFLSVALRPTIDTDYASSHLLVEQRYDGKGDGWDHTQDFGVAFANSGPTEVTLNVSLYAYSSLYAWRPLPALDPSPVSAVPEPATYAMLGAGLALLAGTVRRRARRT